MKAKIVIASVLKPLADPRMHDKLGHSLAAAGGYEVHLIAPGPSAPRPYPGITTHLLGPYPKGRIVRWQYPRKIARLLRQLQPDLLIVNTHELLLTACRHRTRYGTRVVYDIRENYLANLWHQHHYPPVVRHLAALAIRLKEKWLAPCIDHFFLAEKCYEQELDFPGNRYTVLENKSALIPAPAGEAALPRFLLSGTISKEYGVHEALALFRHWPRKEFSLIIAGHCPDKKLRQYLQAVAQNNDRIHLHIADHPIPQQDILRHTTPYTVALLPYRPNKSFRNKIPTKLYEFLSLGVPVLIPPRAEWQKLVENYGKGQVVDFSQPAQIADLSESIDSLFNKKTTDSEYLKWRSEENKLIRAVDNLLA